MRNLGFPGSMETISGMSVRTIRRALAAACIATLSFALLLGFGTWYELRQPLEMKAPSVDLRVTAGSTARAIGRALRSDGIGVNETAFVVAARIWGVTRHLHAGRYRIDQGATLRSILDQLRRGVVEPERVTIVEGSTFAQLRAQLAACADLRHDTLGWPEQRILAAIGAVEPSAEGLFAPDTYSYVPGSSDLDVFRQAYAEQERRLAQAWSTRAVDLPYASPYEALVMASLVEKETGRADERAQIAAVFVNRERRSMPLQTDPAVVYGLGAGFDGHLRKRDLRRDTPFNTYLHIGLPPAPISLPGLASIRAVLHPANSNALYFVARGDGSSEFSRTLREQNQAIDRYLRHRGAHPAHTAPSRLSLPPGQGAVDPVQPSRSKRPGSDG